MNNQDRLWMSQSAFDDSQKEYPEQNAQSLAPEELEMDPAIVAFFLNEATHVSSPPRTSLKSPLPELQIEEEQFRQPTCPMSPILLDSSPSVVPASRSPRRRIKSSSTRPRNVRPYRLSAISTFLTYPKCDYTKELILLCLLSKSHQQPEWAVIAREFHADGTPHIHVLVRWRKKLNIRDPSALDYIGRQHGNYAPVRNLKATMAYILKSDPEPLFHGPVPRFPTPKASQNGGTNRPTKGDEVAELLRAGQAISQLASSHPGYTLLHLKKLQAFQALLQMDAQKRMSLTHHIRINFPSAVSPQDHQIFDWVSRHLFDRERPRKAPQLYIFGPCNHGKTSLIDKLCEVSTCYVMPNDEKYDDLWSNDAYDFAVLDEFQKGQKSAQYLNRFSDGQRTNLAVKGSQVMKTFNIPFIILSNFSPAETIDHRSLQPFLSRFTVIELTSPIEASQLTFEITPKGKEEEVPPVEVHSSSDSE